MGLNRDNPSVILYDKKLSVPVVLTGVQIYFLVGVSYDFCIPEKIIAEIAPNDNIFKMLSALINTLVCSSKQALLTLLYLLELSRDSFTTLKDNFG